MSHCDSGSRQRSPGIEASAAGRCLAVQGTGRGLPPADGWKKGLPFLNRPEPARHLGSEAPPRRSCHAHTPLPGGLGRRTFCVPPPSMAQRPTPGSASRSERGPDGGCGPHKRRTPHPSAGCETWAAETRTGDRLCPPTPPSRRSPMAPVPRGIPALAAVGGTDPAHPANPTLHRPRQRFMRLSVRASGRGNVGTMQRRCNQSTRVSRTAGRRGLKGRERFLRKRNRSPLREELQRDLAGPDGREARRLHRPGPGWGRLRRAVRAHPVTCQAATSACLP